MNTPPHIIVYRSLISGVTALLLLMSGLGLAGHGPLTALHQLASPVTHSLHLDRISG